LSFMICFELFIYGYHGLMIRVVYLASWSNMLLF
jgi:hypothetical protein